MKKSILLVAAMSLLVMACDRSDRTTNQNQDQLSNTTEDFDNTGRNIRDRGGFTKTPFDQSENEADRTITQKVRQAVLADDTLSTNAKNIKIITINGVVTLRGPVSTTRERDAIGKIASNVRGIKNVDNQLEVTSNNNN